MMCFGLSGLLVKFNVYRTHHPEDTIKHNGVSIMLWQHYAV